MTNLASHTPIDPITELTIGEQRECLELFVARGLDPIRDVLAQFSHRDVSDTEALAFVTRITTREAIAVAAAHLATSWTLAGLVGHEPPETDDDGYHVGACERWRFLGIDPTTD